MRDALRRLAAGADRVHANAQRGWYRWSPRAPRWRIEPYLGFGTRSRLTVSGRVLRDIAHRDVDASASAWTNAREFWKRLESDELPGARVRVRLAQQAVDAIADDEGFFETTLDLDPPLGRDGWHALDVELADGRAMAAAQASALVPPASARFGVISDIDDTIVWSNVRRKLRMLSMLARGNARTRKPFKGVGAFYRALQAGASGAEDNPFFYVSSSPWNLFAPLIDFMAVHALPRGPLLLRDFGEHLLFGSEAGAHKHAAIERVLTTYPALPFILIGDSGERDPEIYSDIVRAHPSRVPVVYIRSVDPDPARVEAIDGLVAAVQPTGTQLVLAGDSEFAAAHAASAGYIAADALAAVRADKRIAAEEA
jgi:phosphatidate phosphatase APP1